MTGMDARGARFVTSASNSSGNSVSAECIGTYADGPTKQIVVILYGNGTASRPRRSLDACGMSPGQIGLADFAHRVEVGVGAVAVDDPFEQSHQPGATLTTGRALAARLVGVELGERVRRMRDVGRFVHHHDRARAEHRAGRDRPPCPRTGSSSWSDEPRCRATTGHERLECVVVANALAEVVAVDECRGTSSSR